VHFNNVGFGPIKKDGYSVYSLNAIDDNDENLSYSTTSPGTSPRSAERTDEADGRQLHCEAQPVVIATTTTDKTQIVVVEEEEALQLQPRRRAGEPAVRAGLGIGEELDRHAGSTYRPASPSA